MLEVQYEIPFGDSKLTGTATGETWDAVVGEAKRQAVEPIRKFVSADKGKFVGSLAARWVKKATPLEFAKKVVSEANKKAVEKSPIPSSCIEFVKWAESKGIAKIVSGV